MSTNIGMGPCCLSGKLADDKPVGREETLSGYRVYVSEPQSRSKAKTIIFLTDVFGWEFNNIRILADTYAEKGFYCLVPDVHSGDSLPLSFLQNIEPPLAKQETLGFLDKAKNGVSVPLTLESVSRPIIDGFVNAMRQTPGVNKIGCVGFCWGGRYAILQAHGQKKDGAGSSIGGVDAAYACHPSLLAVPGDFEDVTIPLSIALGKKDSLVDETTRGKIKDALSKLSSPSEVVEYDQQVHGFTLRSDYSSDSDKAAQDKATQQGIDWFNKHLA